LVTPTKAGPDLLASADRAALTAVDPPRVRALIDFVAHHYRYAVVDIPRSDAAVLDSLESAASIVVVSNQELATIRGATRIALAMRQRYGKDRVSVVLSRQDRQAEIGIEDVQAAVGGQIKYVFPNDYRLAVGALHRGVPLMLEGQSALASAIQTFAQDLSGTKPAAVEAAPSSKATSLLGRLTGRR
jgi:Flp pilus assembly CpaE family ATPase